jgi:hypothetical protein
MATSTVRRIPSDRPPATAYWRRRFVTLVLGLSVLALVAWAFSGSLGGSSPAAPAASIRNLSGPSSPAGGSGGHGQTPGSGGHSQSPGSGHTKAATSGHTPAAGAGHTKSASANHHTAGSGAHESAAHGQKQGAAGLLPCPAGTVVLSLFSSQPSYSIRQIPQFEVDVVSTASQACTFDIGSRHVSLRIEAGPLPIWSSGECAEGEASLVTELRRGIPTVVSIGWNGQHSSPGCPVPGAPATRGTYTAVAAAGWLRSNTLVFHVG